MLNGTASSIKKRQCNIRNIGGIHSIRITSNRKDFNVTTYHNIPVDMKALKHIIFSRNYRILKLSYLASFSKAALFQRNLLLVTKN